MPLGNAEFYHFGTSAQMIESVSELQNLELDETKLGLVGGRRHPDQYLQNTQFACPLRRDENHTLWIENSYVPASWQIACEHVLTGVPPNDWKLAAGTRVCLDFVPVGEDQFCLRGYGFRDSFNGKLGDPDTKWFGRPVDELVFRPRARSDAVRPQRRCGHSTWARCSRFWRRPPLMARFSSGSFPAQPAARPDFAKRWQDLPRLSAQQLLEQANSGAALRTAHAVGPGIRSRP